MRSEVVNDAFQTNIFNFSVFSVFSNSIEAKKIDFRVTKREGR